VPRGSISIREPARSLESWRAESFPDREALTGMTLLIAFALALTSLAGVTLGLLGGGGSMLLVPILVYALGLAPSDAAAMSLLVVGLTSLAALMTHARRGDVKWRAGLLFGLSGMIAAYAGGRVSALVPGAVMLGGFGALMLVTALAMLRRPRAEAPPQAEPRFVLAVLPGIGAGFLAGLIGAGGGFLIVPALVFFAGLSLRSAISTSLLVIALQSLAGFGGHLSGLKLNATLTLWVTLAAVAGSVVGARVSTRVPRERLRPAFAGLVAVTGSLVLAQQAGPLWRVCSSWLGALPLASVVQPLAGGALIGLAAASFWVFNGRILGVSGIVGGLTRAGRGDRTWRAVFLLGLLTGGVLMRRVAPAAFGASPVSTGLAILAGLLVGVGTTLANGCTSGHGVCGVSRRSPRSLVATGSFMVAGMLTASLLQHAFGRSS
jgi:uncharacterized membrane protein YfcA/uncharacterized membrane protein YedE/YeeE